MALLIPAVHALLHGFSGKNSHFCPKFSLIVKIIPAGKITVFLHKTNKNTFQAKPVYEELLALFTVSIKNMKN
jgi:hypothetical protein